MVPRLLRHGFSALAAALIAATPAAAHDDSPVGLWRVLDEASGRTDALVRIVQEGDTLQGRLADIFPAPGEDPNPVCTRCKGERRNQPKRGMVFMWGFAQQDNEYGGGRVLDPNTGSIYRAKMWLKGDGEQLVLHGYLGIPLLGRSQTWFRVHDDGSANAGGDFR